MILTILGVLITLGVMTNLFLCVKRGRKRIEELEKAMADELANADSIYEEYEEEIKKLKSDLADAYVSIETVVAHEMKEVDRVHSVLEMVLSGPPNDAG